MEETEKKKVPSKMIKVDGIPMSKDQAYKLWLKGLLAGPVRQQPTRSAWQSGK